MENFKNFYKNKKILVTGGAGFIGSNLCHKLVDLGANVTIVDNFSTGKLINLKKIICRIKIIYGDITNKLTCKKITKDKDIVFHLAALISVPDSIKNPDFCYKTNIEGTKNVLNACRENKVSKFIFSSSASVYGNKKTECLEEDTPNPQTPYAKSKLEGEKLCINFNEKHNIQTAILRYFNVYGKNQNPDSQYAAVVAKFKHNIEKKNPIVIYGDGKQIRDFIHVNKVSMANIIIASQKKLTGNIINIATGKSINLFKLIKKLEKATKTKKTDIIFRPARKDDIKISIANCNKYQKLLNIYNQ